jgi:hypothetical protein
MFKTSVTDGLLFYGDPGFSTINYRQDGSDLYINFINNLLDPDNVNASANQSSPDRQPQYISTGLNDRGSALHIPTSTYDQYFVLPMGVSKEYTKIVLHEPDSLTGNKNIFGCNTIHTLWYPSGNAKLAFYHNSTLATSNWTTSTGQIEISAGTFSAINDEVRIFQNGFQTADGTTSIIPDIYELVELGSFAGKRTTGSGYSGETGVFLLYDRILTVDEIRTVTKEIQDYYRLTKDYTFYFTGDVYVNDAGATDTLDDHVSNLLDGDHTYVNDGVSGEGVADMETTAQSNIDTDTLNAHQPPVIITCCGIEDVITDGDAASIAIKRLIDFCQARYTNASVSYFVLCTLPYITDQSTVDKIKVFNKLLVDNREEIQNQIGDFARVEIANLQNDPQLAVETVYNDTDIYRTTALLTDNGYSLMANQIKQAINNLQIL